MTFRLIVFLVVSFFTASAPHAQSSRAVPMGADFAVDTKWFDPAKCSGAKPGKFYFRTGDRTFAVDAAWIRRATLKNVNAAKPAGGGQLQADIPLQAGCAEEPLDLVRVELVGEAAGLSGSIVIGETAERTKGPSPAAKYIQFLGQKGQCRSTAKPQVVNCIGSKTVDGKHVGVAFLLLTQPDGKIELLENGSPIHARCEQILDKVPCLVAADVSQRTEIKSGIDMAAISAEMLRQRHKALLQFAGSISAE